MTTVAFIARLRELHEKAKRGALPAHEEKEYESSRGELGRLLLVAQHLNHGGKTLRSQFRVARLMKVEIDFGRHAPEKTSTIDLASGGFAVLLSTPQTIGKVVRFTLQLPALGGAKVLLDGTAKVASSRLQGNLHRVSFSFVDVPHEQRRHLEMVIVDEVLARFEKPV